ncbi:spore germination protein GerPC [Brevibacillus fluminis]|uniref:spore germination protein GerPC n=1 Tax=Brevibacillus fluminis TaxID=511487 RepID=UPI003F88FC33
MTMMSPEVVACLEQLTCFLQAQTQQMEQLTKLVEDLQKDVNQLKDKAGTQTITNEYKFDLLKIERLEGTLNIGLNPPKSEDSSISEYAVNQSMDVPAPAKPSDELFCRIQEQIHHYLDTDAVYSLEALEQKYAYPLHDPYRKFIMHDIKNQIDQRIRYYLNQVQPDQLDPAQYPAIEQKVIEKVKRDIEKTCESFLQHLPREAGGA